MRRTSSRVMVCLATLVALAVSPAAAERPDLGPAGTLVSVSYHVEIDLPHVLVIRATAHVVTGCGLDCAVVAVECDAQGLGVYAIATTITACSVANDSGTINALLLPAGFPGPAAVTTGVGLLELDD